MASNTEQALAQRKIGYPLMIRPSVLGGRAMKIIQDEKMLWEYVTKLEGFTRPPYCDKFLENAIESEADAISDGSDAFVPAMCSILNMPEFIQATLPA